MNSVTEILINGAIAKKIKNKNNNNIDSILIKVL